MLKIKRQHEDFILTKLLSLIIKNAAIQKGDSIFSQRKYGLFRCKSFFPGFFKAGRNAIFIDSPDRFGRNFQGNPFVFFRDIKPFRLKIRKKSPESLYV